MSTRPSSAISRRGLLASVAVLPSLPEVITATAARTQAAGVLPSWNDGPAKQTVVDFVRATTDPSSKNFVAPEDRIATFDQDGTLWVEHPLYTQAMFAIDRVHAFGAATPGMEEQRAVQGGALQRSISVGAFLRAGLGGDHLRYPRRHEPGGIRGDRRAVVGDGEASAVQTALHRTGLSADDRGPRLSAH